MRKSPIKKKSEKRKLIEVELRKLKIALALKELRCNGCETSFLTNCQPCDYSHIVTVGSRPDLQLHPKNAVLDCRACHRVWDSKIIEKQRTLKNFDHRVEVIKELAPEIYYLRGYDRPPLPCSIPEDIDLIF